MVKAHPHVHSAVLSLPEPKMAAWHILTVCFALHQGVRQRSTVQLHETCHLGLISGQLGLPDCSGKL